MPLAPPPIDDRRYAQLVEDTLARASVHTPEWTNFNQSDPGVTLVQLFSFLTENLKTEPGERVGQPEFGAGLARFLFEPNNVGTHARMREAMQRALARWEPRIRVEEVEVIAHPDEAETALATITYQLVATASRERISLAIALSAN